MRRRNGPSPTRLTGRTTPRTAALAWADRSPPCQTDGTPHRPNLAPQNPARLDPANHPSLTVALPAGPPSPHHQRALPHHPAVPDHTFRTEPRRAQAHRAMPKRALPAPPSKPCLGPPIPAGPCPGYPCQPSLANPAVARLRSTSQGRAITMPATHDPTGQFPARPRLRSLARPHRPYNAMHRLAAPTNRATPAKPRRTGPTLALRPVPSLDSRTILAVPGPGSPT